MGKNYYSREKAIHPSTQSCAFLWRTRRVTEFKVNFSGKSAWMYRIYRVIKCSLLLPWKPIISIPKRKIGPFLTKRKMDLHLEVFPPCKFKLFSCPEFLVWGGKKPPSPYFLSISCHSIQASTRRRKDFLCLLLPATPIPPPTPLPKFLLWGPPFVDPNTSRMELRIPQ